MKKVIFACLTVATVAATLAVVGSPANADSRDFSSPDERFEYHRMRMLNK